jgi:L-asparaginase
MAQRNAAPDLTVHLLREGIPESCHTASVAVCDRRGRVLLSAGDVNASTFIRSSLKPFQAFAVASTGVLEHYGMTDLDLALMSASHQGSIEQARRVFRILWCCDLEPGYLQCPIPEGKKSALEHNCSGKHAGMLAVCQLRNWPLSDYLSPSHPVQQLILEKLAEMLHIPAAEFLVARDDCGAPTYLMSLTQMASLYGQLASGDNLELERIVRAMTQHPEYVGGEGHFDTELMRISGGTLVSKAGAEGIQCVGRVGEGTGLAIKVADGAKRAKYAVAIHVLRQMGWLAPEAADTLADTFLTLSHYKRLDVVGDLAIV